MAGPRAPITRAPLPPRPRSAATAVAVLNTKTLTLQEALDTWYKQGHHFCPRSGVQLKRLNVIPNHNLKDAINRWRLFADMSVQFKPIMSTMLSVQRQAEAEAAAAAVQAEKQQAEAAEAVAAEVPAAGEELAGGAGGPVEPEVEVGDSRRTTTDTLTVTGSQYGSYSSATSMAGSQGGSQASWDSSISNSNLLGKGGLVLLVQGGREALEQMGVTSGGHQVIAEEAPLGSDSGDEAQPGDQQGGQGGVGAAAATPGAKHMRAYHCIGEELGVAGDDESANDVVLSY